MPIFFQSLFIIRFTSLSLHSFCIWNHLMQGEGGVSSTYYTIFTYVLWPTWNHILPEDSTGREALDASAISTVTRLPLNSITRTPTHPDAILLSYLKTVLKSSVINTTSWLCDMIEINSLLLRGVVFIPVSYLDFYYILFTYYILLRDSYVVFLPTSCQNSQLALKVHLTRKINSATYSRVYLRAEHEHSLLSLNTFRLSLTPC